MDGVYAGALSHFGYKVMYQLEPPNSKNLSFKFTLERIEILEGACSFSSLIYH